MALEPDDIRAAVAAGVIDERQAAQLVALGDDRAGKRAAMNADDEPFELFRGFNEIFVSLGVALLGIGVWALVGLVSGSLIAPAILGGALAWGLAEYFTIRRRMILPSILLVIGWSFSVAGLIGFFASAVVSEEAAVVVGALGGLAGSLAFFRRFRVPFALFVTAVSGFVAMLVAVGLVDPAGWEAVGDDGPAALFDLRQAGWVSLGTLAFGFICFGFALSFDMRDPHRVSRLSACAFWLHLIAAPAIVNTVLLTLFNLGSGLAMIALLLMIAALTVVALVMDRRSFLVSALLYLALLLILALESAEVEFWAFAPLTLGLFITALGAGWTRIRNWLMAATPGFPGKDRLPPYYRNKA